MLRAAVGTLARRARGSTSRLALLVLDAVPAVRARSHTDGNPGAPGRVVGLPPGPTHFPVGRKLRFVERDRKVVITVVEYQVGRVDPIENRLGGAVVLPFETGELLGLGWFGAGGHYRCGASA